jgi:hypothetical protein
MTDYLHTFAIICVVWLLFDIRALLRKLVAAR